MGNIPLYTWLRVIIWILNAIGMYKIFTKCRISGLWGFVPAVRYYRLSEICGRELDGLSVAILDIFETMINYLIQDIDIHTPDGLVLFILFLAISMAIFVYKLRIISALTKVFGLKKRWLFLWAVLPWLTMLIWGFHDSIQPENLDTLEQDAMMAGTSPAALSDLTLCREDDPVEGLNVHLKDRTVRSAGKKRYLLKDIDLHIPCGTMTLLLGGSGAGKTTLINAILGYEKANAEVHLNGQDIYRDYSHMKYKVGFVPQQELLRMNDTVMSTLMDAAKLRLPKGTGRKKRKERVEEVMDILGLSAGKSGLVSKKSGGMRKRISIGMELISDPDLFVLDEPDSGLDGVIARELFLKLQDVAKSGKIVLVITHTPDRVIDLFDRVIVLARDSGRVGRLAFSGTVDEAREFFDCETMEQIIMQVNGVNEGGQGKADEMIDRFIHYRSERQAA